MREWVFLFCFFVCTFFFSCNGPCAPKEKWHRKQRIIVIVMMMMIIIIGRLSSCAWLKKEARASKTAWIMGDWVSGWLGGWLAG